MSKCTNKRYEQKFRKEWLNDDLLKQWLVPVAADTSKAYCKFCKCDIKAKYQDLKQHIQSKKYMNACPFKNRNLDSFVSRSDSETSKLEASISLFLCCHSAISNCDHLVDMCKNNISHNKAVSDMKMHRTKCTNIIKNTLCRYFQTDLQEDIGENNFSILIDESNDITVHKLLGMSIIYYSNSERKVVSTYLGLIELESCNAEHIVSGIKIVLNSNKLKLMNLVAIGTDNANVMVGINNGVYAKLKAEIPSLILIRCVCHSIQLAVSQASAECLPRSLNFMIVETHKWFSHSPVRQIQYKNLFQTLNSGSLPLKIPRDCQTRWLSIQPAVQRILEQWLELKTHFQVTRLSEKCYTAEILYEMYSDEKNLAYLLFLNPVLIEVQQVNKLFESKNIEKVKLLNDLILLIKSIGKKLVLPTCNIDLLNSNIDDYLNDKPYLGYRFEIKIEELKNQNILTKVEETNIRRRCSEFLLFLYKQLKQRLPENVKILQNISFFSVNHMLQPVKDIAAICEVMKFLGASETSLSRAEYQLNKIYLVNWTNKEDTEAFWNEVGEYKDASGFNPFSELFQCAISALILPHSNAEIERVFSAINYVKSKLRNKMTLELLNAILTIKFGLIRKGKCCSTYSFPSEVIKEIGTVAVYQNQTELSTYINSSYMKDDDDFFELLGM